MDKRLRHCRQPAFRGIVVGRLIAWHWQALLSVAVCGCKECRKYLIPGNHERRWIVFWFVQNMNATLPQQSNTPGKCWMTYQVHLQARDGNDRRGSPSERFA